MKKDPSQTDPTKPDYWTEARDSVIKLIPFYDPNHKCEVVRGHVFDAVVAELKARVTPAAQNPADRVKQLIDELVALDHPEMTLYAVGFCPKCEATVDHQVDEPFAACECGTGEDCSGPGLIQRLRARITEELPRPESQPLTDDSKR